MLFRHSSQHPKVLQRNESAIPMDDMPLASANFSTRSGVTGPHRKHHRASPEEKENMKQFESLDFHIADNMVYRQYLNSIPKRAWIEKSFGKWLICVLIGLIVGVVAYGIRWTVESLNEVKFHIAEHYLHEHGGVAGFFVYYAMNVGFSTIAYFFVFFSSARASSSGIPEVMGYLNGIRIPQAFNVRTFLAKVSSLIFSYSSSLALGPEGPMIHIGALVGASVGPAKSKTLKIHTRTGWAYRNDKDKRDFISCGTAAGISAAFGAPIGGTLYALEEASSFWSKQLGWRTFFCCMIAAFTVNGIVQAKDQSQQVHDFGLLSFGFSTAYLYRYAEMFPFALIGIIGGLIGALFVHLNVRLNKFRRDYLSKRHKLFLLLEVILVVTITSVICYGVASPFRCRNKSDWLAPSGNTAFCDKKIKLELRSMFCEEKDEYNAMASLLWSPPNAALQILYSRQKALFSLYALGVFCIIYFFLAVITSGLYVAGGLFIPMMLVGASFGRFVGEIIYMIFPDLSPSIDPSIYALIGSAAVMSGFCRMTISLVVILVELTSGTQYLLPIILVVMISKWVGDLFNESVYEHLIELKCIPFLHGQPPRECALLNVTDVMKPKVVTFREIEKVETIVEALSKTTHHGFPVIALEERGSKYRGLILRSHLAILLSRRMFMQTRTDGADTPKTPSEITYPEFAELLASKIPEIKASEFSDGEMNMYIDLTQYMNNSAVVVKNTFSFVETYNLFRTMGLRHIPVLDDYHQVVGIVTRKDLL